MDAAARPVIALLTDFGVRDHYVASMKGAVLAVCPEAVLVDISHDVQPQAIGQAARMLRSCWPDFPTETVFLVVVDPGVGSARRAVAVRSGLYSFVGPDNGVFTPVYRRDPRAMVVELRNARYRRPHVSATFEGRDRFAPAAAWLARGVSIEDFGPTVRDPIALEDESARVDGDGVSGTVVHVDRFGNLVTNVAAAQVKALAMVDTAGALVVTVGSRALRVVRTYADGRPGEVVALVGSADEVEIAACGANAATTLGLGVGAAVRIGVRRAER
ncbi:MAG: SAM-dependent chlorinase/fluorinase [Vicinamibacterales bacterium]